jgi:hypothetical protein
MNRAANPVTEEWFLDLIDDRLPSQAEIREIPQILMDFLNSKLLCEYEGQKYSMQFNEEEQCLTCWRKDSNEVILQAQYKSNEWEVSDDSLLQEDVDFFKRILQPKLESHAQANRQIYQTVLSSTTSQNPRRRDEEVAERLLALGCIPLQVGQVLNQSDNFKNLSPGQAMDYRRQLLMDARRLLDDDLEL